MITKSMVIEAQTTWGKGVVQIGTLKNSPKECVVFTKQFVEQLYAFEHSTVLFKPTKCAVQQFRPSAAEAISYFIAGEQRACQEDKGFALQPWTQCSVRKLRFDFGRHSGNCNGQLLFYRFRWTRSKSRVHIWLYYG